MKTTMFLVTLAVAASACDKAPDPTPSAQAATAADNTKKNLRDRQDTLTPGDQKEDETDLTITQTIRKAVMSDDKLSMDAKNVKIITVNGVVTLRGPVKNRAEVNDIKSFAEATANVKRVDNQLEIAAN
jgi:osmotically-inducible protein OsmY